MPNEPVSYKGVMVSSTFTDLVEHREALIKVINGQRLMPIVMEYDSAKPGIDVLDSSLQMVRDASAYVGVISHKYGQIPDDPRRAPLRAGVTPDREKPLAADAVNECLGGFGTRTIGRRERSDAEKHSSAARGLL
jgi:hypothetical protein